MNSPQNNLNVQRKFSGKNDRYNFNSLSRDQFYFPTESNQFFQNQRRVTSTSYRKSKINPEQTGFPNVYTSGCPHNTANLYLNKKNFSFKKKSNKKGNNYYDKEKLYQNMMKLQVSLNNMNLKYHKQKMENDKQAKEIERQNKFLNLINSHNMRNMDLLETNNFRNENNSNLENIDDSRPDNNFESKNNDLMKNIIKENENSVEAGVIQIDDKKYNLSNYNNNISKNSLKKLYEDLYQECKYRDKLLIKKEKDKEKYTTENGVLKVANETLISNLKLHMKKLEQENAQKEAKIKELKKNIKCSRYTELLKENEVLNTEMEKLKNKIKNALALINEYKKQEQEIKKLYEVIKKKDFKIKALELELTTLANNSDETTKKLQSEIVAKDKLLKRQDRDLKKSAFEKYSLKHGLNYEDRYGSDDEGNNKNKKKEIDVNNICKKFPELYQFYIEMKHKDITNTKSFFNDVLKKIKDTISIEDAKIKYISLILSYFNISDDDENSKQIIVKLANKEFIPNRSIYEIKKKQLNLLDNLFEKEQKIKSKDEIKSFAEKNSLEELIKRVFAEADKNKLGYITFDEMKNAINETNLNAFNEEVMLMTKSEIFNRFDYFNIVMLFNTESNSENKTEQAKTEVNDIKDIKDDENNKVIISDSKENNTDNNKGESNENKVESKEGLNQNDENKDNEKQENDNQKNDNIKNNNNEENNDIKNKIEEVPQGEDLEKKLKSIVHKIRTEGGTPVNYFSQLKETITITRNEYEVINLKKLKEFLGTKNIELTEEEMKQLKVEYGLNTEDNEEINKDDYIIYENFVQKLLNIIQNESDNDDNFMENIPKMDFADE